VHSIGPMKAQDLIGALEATGMTRYQMAQESTLTEATLSRILGGQPRVMSDTLEKLEALCRQKGIDPNNLPRRRTKR
jgi:transcriptional regulator with XRE-family HTH domain